MKILMFGWEFPPFNSGGLGVACEGLAKALAREGKHILFVLPKRMDCQHSFTKLIFADGSLEIKTVNALLLPYITEEFYRYLIRNDDGQVIYSSDLFSEVMRYAEEARKIARIEDFDIIHAHDWLSIPAALIAKEVSQKPLVVHIHATEFDRTGSLNINKRIYEIEKRGVENAERVIAVSNFTKNKILQHYGISPEKVQVIYNAINHSDYPPIDSTVEVLKNNGKKIVIFVGRITLQKGPDWFLKAAKKVLERDPNVLFIIAGAGDLEARVVEEAAALNIADKVLFAGFLRGNDLRRLYQMADLYVLSSVSEPFGITTLEALVHRTPALISKQSGVSEVLSHCLKVDFWDTDEMANKILAVLKYAQLQSSLRENGHQEVKRFNWQDAARQCLEIYSQILQPPAKALNYI